MHTFLPWAVIAAMLSYALASSVTPGPNNLMLMASGVNFGMRRTVPHMLGVWVGCVAVMLAIGFGIGVLFSVLPTIRIVIEGAGIIYTLWLAWKIATAGSFGADGNAAPHPFRFPAAVAFQWVNPKLWVVSISAMAIYVRPVHLVADILVVSAVFSLINIPCILIWAGFGAVLSDFLKLPDRIRVFNMTMGGLLVLSVLVLLPA